MNRLERLKSLIEEDPKSTFALFAIAKEYEKLEDLQQARHFYRVLEEIDEDYVGLYYHFGKLLVKLGEIENAIQVYAKGINIAKKIGDHHAWSELATAKMEIDED